MRAMTHLLLLILVAVTALAGAVSAWAMEPGDADNDAPGFSSLNSADDPLQGLIEDDGTIGDADADADDADTAMQPAGSLLALPTIEMTDAEIRQLLQANPAALGSMSIGYTNSGALVNGVPMPSGANWQIVNARETYGTRETVNYIVASINKVSEAYPGTPRISVGDISDQDGGRLNRHASHQAGRDVDLGYYYKDGECRWYAAGSAANLDLPRNWALVRALLVNSDVEMIFLDASIQKLLYAYALSIGEDQAWLDTVFQFPNGGRRAVIRHARRHNTHYHVRFYNPRAQEMGRRAYPQMIAIKMVPPPTYYVYHRVRSGETLGGIARRYGTSVAAIRGANGLRSNLIRAGRSYRIPRRGGVARVPAATAVPPRHVPPTVPTVLAHVDWTPQIGPVPMIRRPFEIVTDLEGHRFAQLATVKPAADTPPPGAAQLAAAAAEQTAKQVPVAKRSVARRPSALSYRVRNGDNLWTIARRHGVSVKDIKRWNRLSSNRLRPGQRLTIYVRSHS